MVEKKRSILKVSVILLLTCSLLQLASVLADGQKPDAAKLDAESAMIEKLRNLAGNEPAVISEDQIALQREVARTKRLDAAAVLIKSLSMSLTESTKSGELQSQIDLIPAIELLKKYYGPDLAPLLYAEALGTKHEWLRGRIALATRHILDKETITRMNMIYSLRDSRNTQAKEFLEMLNRPILRVELPQSLPEFERKAMEGVHKALEKKAKEGKTN